MISATSRSGQARGDAATSDDSIGTTRKDQIMDLRFLPLAATTALLLNTLAGLTPAAAQTAAQHTALASDSNFIQTTMSLGLLQVKLGKLAQEKGSSDVVRDFGQRMLTDYSKVNEQLATAARQAAYPHPVLLREHQQTVERFKGMGRSSFDKNYIAEMVSRHGDAAKLFEAEAKSGRVQSLKQLAAGLLPDMQRYQSLATQAAGAVGADVTASASSEQ
jgi:putative membrane protein